VSIKEEDRKDERRREERTGEMRIKVNLITYYTVLH
jgi:hypothetical protein